MNRFILLMLFCALQLFAAIQSAAQPTASSGASAGARAPRATVTIINLNTADAATLAREMDGIGEAKARAIVEHRQRNGAFRSVDELALVKGVGGKTVEANRPRLTVGVGGTAKGSAAAGKAQVLPGNAATTRRSTQR
jgi:competence protein ComEA